MCETADFQCNPFIYFAFFLVPRPTGEISGQNIQPEHRVIPL